MLDSESLSYLDRISSNSFGFNKIYKIRLIKRLLEKKILHLLLLLLFFISEAYPGWK